MTRNSIYVKPVELRARDIDEFYAILPGIKATVVYKSKGEYQITNLELNDLYFKAGEDTRPGLYHARRSLASWSSKYDESGEVQKTSNRAIAIADASYIDAHEAANGVSKYVEKAPGVASGHRFETEGFDLHYTARSGSLGGLTRYDALKNRETYDSALLLARSMQNAKSVDGANWISAFGGSAVLTQALEILSRQNMKLPGHSIFLHRPRTSSRQAIKLAHQLEMSLDKKASNIGFFDPLGAASNLRVAPGRIKNEKDYYDANSLVSDVLKGSLQSIGIAGAGVGLAVTTTYATAVPALITLVKAASWTTVGTTAAGIANHAFEPHAHKVKRALPVKK